MIRNDAEYAEATKKLQEQRARIQATKKELAKTHTRDEVERALDPQQSFHLQLQEEVENYERMKRGEFDEIQDLQGLGNLLIGLRIHRGLTQKQLADLLEIHESQVSRDERNEYHNITLERARKILKVLGAELHSALEIGEATTV